MILTQQNVSFGDQIGRYRLLAELARGGMGIVYVAAAQGPAGFTKLVAVKELQPELVRDGDFLTMFLEEARMAARLNHPNIVQTIDVSESDGRHFIAMEYLEGRSFYQVLRRFAGKGGFPLRLALSVLRDALSALDYAHELCDADGRRLGFVHRDMSPHNLFVSYDGYAKVIDFGIAKARDSSLETKTGVLKGRTHYMAPEQLTHQADCRTDLFSMGVMLFEVAAGRRLWKGLGEIEILGRLMRGEIPPLSTAKHEIPGPLWQICHTALSANPDHRFASAAEMREALDAYLWQTGGIPRPKEVADALTAEFAVERQRAREIIDAALARLQRGDSGRLEVLAAVEPRESTHHAATPSAVSRPPTGSWPAMQAEPQLTPLPQSGLDKVRNFLREQRLALGATALGMVLAVTTMVVAFYPHPPPPPPVPVGGAMPVAVPAAQPMVLPQPVRPDTIELSIACSPANAQLFLDGQVLPSNPFLGRFPRSTEMHRVRATAAGFEPRERLVSFADNVMLDLSLTPRQGSAPRVAEAAPPAPARGEPPRRVEVPRERPVRTRAAPPPAKPAPPPAAPPPVVVAPPPPPPRASAPADIVPRTGSEPPRRRAIDTTNPYGDDR